MKNILSYIEQAEKCNADRIALSDGDTNYTYKDLILHAKCIGCRIGRLHVQNHPVIVFMDKTPACVAAFLGVVYSGNFYIVLDPMMPLERISRIFETLHPAAVITDAAHLKQAMIFSPSEGLIEYEETLTEPVCESFLSGIRSNMTESDPLYVLYTSGSTGRPKGTVVSHRAVIAYTKWAIDTFGIDENTIFGSQTPFYFSMSVTDLYCALRTGARLQIIPKTLFSFPLMLMEYINKYSVNTIYWVPSALCIVANWDTFAYAKPEHLEKVLFAGEVMPNKQLNYWRHWLPDLLYANLFGPTETTDICTYYIVDRGFADNEALPIGRPCDNCRTLILDEYGREADRGELYVGGPFLANGYYNDPEKSQTAFVQNPLNTAYAETLYRTGDLVSRSEDGELFYIGRRDYQIKHMGYRIELGEIEANAGAAEGVGACACLYETNADQLILIYQGRAKTDMLMEALRCSIPGYMLPNKIIRMKSMPYNASGKIDRKYLQEHYKELLEDKNGTSR